MKTSTRFDETAKLIRNSANETPETSQDRAGQAADKLQNLKDGSVVPIPIELIDVSQNCRKITVENADPEFIQLVESIREVGILQNPVVTIYGRKIVCVTGHRRIAALLSLDTKLVSCTIKHFENLETKQVAQLIENTSRKAMYPLDIAESLKQLKSAGYNQVKLESVIGMDRKTIGRFQKIANWPIDAKELIHQYAKILNTKVLISLASRTLSDEQIVTSLKEKAGIISKKQSDISCLNSIKKVNDYCLKKRFSSEESQMIFNALSELGYIKLVNQMVHESTAMNNMFKNSSRNGAETELVGSR